ncbi:MAG: PQQ-dependent sugar dehydrogenase [Pirellulaceae bacterium]|nr:PQQ-dependent sugar dehydrogenase [Planctomycetales bacterium]
MYWTQFVASGCQRAVGLKKAVTGIVGMAAVASALADAVQAAAPAVIQPGIQVRLDSFAAGLSGDGQGSPLDLVPIPGGDGRIAIATYQGAIRLVDAQGAFLDTLDTPYLATGTDWLPDLYGTTGIAFHPGFADGSSRGYGKVYAIVSEGTIASPGGPVDFNPGVPDSTFAPHYEVLVEFTASDPSSDNPEFSRRDVMRVRQPSGIHNLTDLAFDSKGHLFLPFGDSQSGINAQEKGNYLGTVFRIDPLDPASLSDAELGNQGLVRSQNGAYAVPTSNPTFGIPAELNEIFAYGLRSPYRVTVDRGATDGTGKDHVYIGDVGGGTREEIDRLEIGGNYGWSLREGTLGNQPAGGSIDPIFELAHDLSTNSNGLIAGGVTIIGGFVYRGSQFPQLQGKYVFGEMGREVSTSQQGNRPRLFYGDLQTGEIFQILADPFGESLDGRVLLSIGEDALGELYAVAGDDPGFPIGTQPDGVVLKLTPSSSPFLPGDVNLDGVVAGDGTGDAAIDDVTAFLIGWGTTGHDGPNEQWTHGDMDLDGETGLFDWHILRTNHPAGSALELDVLLAGRIVPEPQTLIAASFAFAVFLMRRRRIVACSL